MRFILKTTAATTVMFLAFYPSRSDLMEMGACWALATFVLGLGAYITWKTEFAEMGAAAGIRAALISWCLPDAPRAPSGTPPSRRGQSA
jgi:hypothetical protein